MCLRFRCEPGRQAGHCVPCDRCCFFSLWFHSTLTDLLSVFTLYCACTICCSMYNPSALSDSNPPISRCMSDFRVWQVRDASSSNLTLNFWKDVMKWPPRLIGEETQMCEQTSRAVGEMNKQQLQSHPKCLFQAHRHLKKDCILWSLPFSHRCVANNKGLIFFL